MSTYTLHELVREACSHIVLDVGCGRGRSTLALTEACSGSYVIGMDISFEKLREAKMSVGLSSVDILCADASHMPLRDSAVESITMVFALHEIEVKKVDAVLQELKRVLKRGGKLLIVDRVRKEGLSIAETLPILTEDAYHKAEEYATGVRRLGVKTLNEIIEILTKYFKVEATGEVTLGKRLAPEEFLTSWGRETIGYIAHIRNPRKRSEVEELIKKIRELAEGHGYGPIHCVVVTCVKE